MIISVIPSNFNMTETESKKVEAAGDHDPKTEKKILRQIEHYFGDFNLPRDKFLLEEIKNNEGGWIAIETMLKFQRLSKLSDNAGVILGSLKDSELMEIDEKNNKIRRKPDLAVPEHNEERKKELTEMTVYCKGFDKEIKEIDVLLDFFEAYEGVSNVVMRTWFDNKDKEKTKNFKGSVFVTFKTKALAQAFMDLESVKYKEEELIRKFQNDYFKEKQDEVAAKRKAKSDNRKNAKDAKKAAAAVNDADNEEESSSSKGELSKDSLPKGSILILDNLNETTTRENIKDALKSDFEVDPENIAFIYYQKGESTAKLRFKVEKGAINALEAITKSEKTFKLNNAEVAAKVLEGDEEKEFLQQCIDDMQARKNKNRGHKRRGGFNKGGRGGKKPRM